jgi:hypothetical protein
MDIRNFETLILGDGFLELFRKSHQLTYFWGEQ